MDSSRLDAVPLDALRRMDTCAVANAIETSGVRLRNTGFTDSSVHCIFPELSPMVGYAATVRIRTVDPPMEGDRYYYRLDWLDHLLSIPMPRVLVLEDMDERPGLGSFVGDVHANILAALGCAGIVTNGAVRNIPQVRPLGLQVFAGNLSVSHAYAHVVDFGQPVVVGRMEVRPGDLLHGDMHGVQNIPLAVAPDISRVAAKMMEQERSIIDSSRSPDFTMEKLRAEIEALKEKRSQSQR
jgi:4-hydroxy-4-methyl-2-oxoglutarate aldolase